MAVRGRRAAGGLTVTGDAPHSGRQLVTVRVITSHASAQAKIAAALSSAADLSVTDTDEADVLVFDIHGPAPAPRSVVRESGTPKLVLLVGAVDEGWALAALHAGARAVLPRSAESAALIEAVRAVAAGLVVLHPDAIAPDGRESGAPFFADVDPDSTLAAPLEPLTERELQVLRLLADGLSNKAIARRLAISDHTVKFHLAAVFSKLDAKTRAEALARGVRFGLIHL